MPGVSQAVSRINMSTTSAPPTQPFGDAYLLAYSAEHVRYEFDMFNWLGQVCGNPTVRLRAPSSEDATRLNNVLVESFAIHVRNVIDFLYMDTSKPTDVVAADFFPRADWAQTRPPISPSLNAARVRANKEIAHLTTDRIAGSPPEKAWDFAGLAAELRPVLRLFISGALSSRLSATVATAVR